MTVWFREQGIIKKKAFEGSVLELISDTSLSKRANYYGLRTTDRAQPHRAAPLLRSWVRFPAGAWICVCCECRVLSGRGLCDELITRPEESYRLWCVVVCDLKHQEWVLHIYIYIYDISSLRVK